MIMHPLQKYTHKIRTAILLTIDRKLVKKVKVFLEHILVCLASEMNINACSSTPLIDSALNLILEH
jgi:hypothetical protein